MVLAGVDDGQPGLPRRCQDSLNRRDRPPEPIDIVTRLTHVISRTTVIILHVDYQKRGTCGLQLTAPVRRSHDSIFPHHYVLVPAAHARGEEAAWAGWMA